MCLFSQLCVPQEWSQKLEQVDQQLLKQNPALQKQKLRISWRVTFDLEKTLNEIE